MKYTNLLAILSAFMHSLKLQEYIYKKKLKHEYTRVLDLEDQTNKYRRRFQKFYKAIAHINWINEDSL